jgi:BirA family transcriptional regulator, biotin operon repressor / biotin---[acetyl-CoA-carboxylase] ligase
MENLFDVEFFNNQLRTTWVGSEFIHIKKVDSTNSWLKKIPSKKLVHGTVVNTDHQVNGRGQYERNWHAAPGKNLTFTIGLRPPGADRLTLLTMASAYALSTIIEQYTEHTVKIKWPNDVMIDGKKVGGILTECIFLGSKPDRVLIGIGLNIAESNFQSDLAGSAISLKDVSKVKIRKEKLLCECLSAFEQCYHKWHKHDNELHQSISQKMIGYGEWVRLKVDHKFKEGKYKFLGINEKGELLVLNEELDVNTFSHEQVRIVTDNY